MTYSFDIQIFDSTFDDFNIDDHIEATRIKLLNTLPIPYGNYPIIQTEDTESVQTVDYIQTYNAKNQSKISCIGSKIKNAITKFARNYQKYDAFTECFISRNCMCSR